MADPIAELLNPARLLFDLQRANELAQSIAGCLNPEVIAKRITDGLVEKFDGAFARIWLLEADQRTLKLVASSGMYTRTDGSFGRVAMGAYKVGKIAQNQVAFLSNSLADEPWVGDREWAIANHMRGFAGYPLLIDGKAIGVLAIFSHHAMEPEFLEVLQSLCTMVAIALAAALQHQQDKQLWYSTAQSPVFSQLSLSDQLANILDTARLTLVGTEQPLSLSVSYIFLQAAETLQRVGCTYCRLIYTAETIALEAIVPVSNLPPSSPQSWAQSVLNQLLFLVSCLGGVLQTQMDGNQTALHVLVKIPRSSAVSEEKIRIQCRSPVLQMAFTQLAFSAGLTVWDFADQTIPLLTDDRTLANTNSVVWIQHSCETTPKGVQAKVDLAISPEQLRQAIAAVSRNESWGLTELEVPLLLSDRELEMMTLLAEGLRDRDIANRLIISESTVKFHINNVLTKLRARTRYQALHQVIVNGWI